MMMSVEQAINKLKYIDKDLIINLDIVNDTIKHNCSTCEIPYCDKYDSSKEDCDLWYGKDYKLEV